MRCSVNVTYRSNAAAASADRVAAFRRTENMTRARTNAMGAEHRPARVRPGSFRRCLKVTIGRCVFYARGGSVGYAELKSRLHAGFALGSTRHEFHGVIVWGKVGERQIELHDARCKRRGDLLKLAHRIAAPVEQCCCD